MNIDNSIGMTLFSGESGGMAAIGGQQGNSAAESPEGSLFQQLITQMLTAKNQTADAASGNLNAGEQSKSGGTGDMLTELLFAGRTVANIGLQKTGGTTGEKAEIKGASSEKQATDENAEAMGMLQALMAGMTNTAAAVNVEKAFMGIQAGKPAGSQLAAINTVSAASGNPETMDILKQMANNTALQAGFNETKAPVDSMTGLTNTAEGMPASQMGIRQTQEEQKQMLQTGPRLEATIPSIEPLAPEKTAQTNNEAGKPDAFASQSLLTTKVENGNLTEASGIQTLEESAVPLEKAKQATESAEGTDPARAGFQNSVQGAMTTGDIAESGTLNQTIESPQPYSQIREEILTRLEKNGPTEFKMQLEPEDLGQIDIKLKLSEGKLVIDILAADSRTQALLTSQVDKLISSMGLQNVQVESVQVSQQMNSQTQDNSQSQGFTMNSAMDFSQKRQQEQNRQEILNNAKLTGTFSQQQDETKTNETMSRIESIRFDNHRMNYSV